jgi:hypothetical protein
MTKMSLEIIGAYLAISAEDVWDRLRASHGAMLHDETACDLYGESCTLGEIRRRLKRRGKPHFDIRFAGGELRFGNVGNSDHSFVQIRTCVEDFTDAWEWCRPFTIDPFFRQARLFDADYDHWQNAEDPLEYTTLGRPYKHLPMKSNGLPPPLEQTVIDTSANPGRRTLRQGYVEAVGSLMWLGASFWALTGASREQVRDQPWLKCDDLQNGVLRIQVIDATFATAEGKLGELQNALRALLFPLAVKSKAVSR